jgi:hypothetical protein
VPRATHILQVPVIGQPTGYECGNTALACVLQYLGKHYTVSELAALAGTSRSGTDHADMIAGAVKTGAHVFARSGGGRRAIKEIVSFVSRGLPVICGWWSMSTGDHPGQADVDYHRGWTLRERIARDCGHYSVLRGYTPSTLLFMDPQDSLAGTTTGYCEYTDAEWLRVWYDTDTPAYQLVKNWYMVVNFDGRLFADEIGDGADHRPGRR